MSRRRLSHFDLLDEIGSGGMGVVYRARDTRLNRLVAVKVLPEAGRGDHERRRFLGEAQAASGINHPAVVTIFEVDSDDGTDFIAMELVEGRSLAAELANGRLSIGRALRLGIAVTDGLAAAHRVGLVHRDLKPANLMLGPEDRIKILDFGLVKRVEATGAIARDAPTARSPASFTDSGLIVGTPAYMSPEQARGEAVDARSDLFSLGCVLYEMLTGRRAFAGETPIQILSNILSSEPQPATELPAQLAALIGRLLAKNPSERPASAEATRRELEAIAAALDGIPTASVPAIAPGQRPIRRFIGIAGLIVVVAIAAVIAFRVMRPVSAPDYQFRLLSESTTNESHASFSSDGASVAFVREDENGVSQVWIRSLAGGDPLQLTRGDVPADSPDWSPAGDRIVFGRRGDGIWEVAPLGGAPRRLVEHGVRARLSTTGDRLVFISRDRLWTAQGDGSDAEPVPGVETSTFAQYTAAAVFSPDGRWIAYFWPDGQRPMGDLYRVPAAGGTPERLTSLEHLGAGLDWSPDGRWIVFSSDHGGSRTLWRIPAAGGTPEAVTVGAGEDSHPRLSSDGRRLAYTNQRNLHLIERLDPASGRRQRVLERRVAPYMPDLSRDGSHLAFFSRVPEATQLFVVPLDGGHEKQLTFGADRIRIVPQWSGDGQSLYYYSQSEADLGLRRIDLEAGHDKAVVPGWAWVTQQWAAVSPDEKRVAYLTRDTGGNAIDTRVLELASGKEQALPAVLLSLDWFADGRHLSGMTEDARIFVCDVPALTCRQVTTGAHPHPSEDGRWLYFLRSPGRVAWRRELESGQEERLADLEGEFRPLAFGWGIRPNGELVWLRTEPGREEIWLGELQ